MFKTSIYVVYDKNRNIRYSGMLWFYGRSLCIKFKQYRRTAVYNYILTRYKFIMFLLYRKYLWASKNRWTSGSENPLSVTDELAGMHLYSFNDGAFAGSSCSYDNGGYKWRPGCFPPAQPPFPRPGYLPLHDGLFGDF